MNAVIEELNRRMHEIADKNSLSFEDLKFLEECLCNKWYSVQVVAAKVLAKHHPPEARLLLKDWLMRHENHHQIIKVAQTALLSCITDDDIPWIFDLYQKKKSRHRSFLIGALLQFPNKAVFQSLIQNCQNQQNFHSMIVLGATLLTDREAVLQSLLKTYKTKKDLQEVFHHGPIRKDQIVIFQRFRNPV